MSDCPAPDHGLNARQIDILRRILAPYAEKIDRVGLFGSRATGKARRNSDIDMVLYGAVTEADIDQLRISFDESGLAVTVDITAYHLISYPALKTHIDAVMQVLFARKDLETGKS